MNLRTNSELFKDSQEPYSDALLRLIFKTSIIKFCLQKDWPLTSLKSEFKMIFFFCIFGPDLEQFQNSQLPEIHL